MLRVERDGDVAVVTLDRPEKRNALSIELREEMAAALRSIESRCTVVTGAGSAFCAGMDVTQFGSGRRLVDATESWLAALLEHPVPLIAAVNGPAMGGGFALALLCDIRVAAPSARFGFPEIRRGIPPALGAALKALPRAVAHDLCLTGREIEAEEALRLGVVSAVGDDALERARAIAALPDRGVRQVVAWSREGGEWRDQLAREGELLRRAALDAGTGAN